jgi:retron-type reverse transcriptase
MMIEDLKVFHKTYEFIKWLHFLLNKFPKSVKYTMAQKIENTSLNVLEGIIQSNNEFDKEDSIKQTIIELDKLRVFFRMSKDMQFISFEQYENGARQIDEIGRMLGGMLKSIYKKKQDKTETRVCNKTEIREKIYESNKELYQEKPNDNLKQTSAPESGDTSKEADKIINNKQNNLTNLVLGLDYPEDILKSLDSKKDWVGLNLSGRAVKRGGNWDNGANAGLFTANMNNAPSDSNTNIGFRCCNSFQGQIYYFYGNSEQRRKTTSIQIQVELLNQLNIKIKAPIVSKRAENYGAFIYKIYLKMKTCKNLFENIISLENLYNAYIKARRGKSERKEVLKFTYNLEKELFKLQNQLINGEYKIGKYRRFIIFEPKKREISALPFRDRVVQHAICNIIEPIFEKKFIHDSYACRKGKGSHAGLKRLRKFLIKGDFYILKCDIKSYFPSINHEVLKKILKKTIADLRLIKILDEIIDSSEKGLPIGNLTSQLFANIYLNELDYFVKHELKIKLYIRYMDDFIILHENKEILCKIKEDIIKFLCSLRLEMHETKARIFPHEMGIDFLGYVVFGNYMKARKRTVKRGMKKLKNKMKKYDKEVITFDKLMESINSFDAYLNHADTHSLKKNLKQEMKNVM